MQVHLPIKIVQTRIKRTFEFPLWMKYAFDGKKIMAIKELRSAGRADSNGSFMNIMHAKNIVESVMSGVNEQRFEDVI